MLERIRADPSFDERENLMSLLIEAEKSRSSLEALRRDFLFQHAQLFLAFKDAQMGYVSERSIACPSRSCPGSLQGAHSRERME